MCLLCKNNVKNFILVINCVRLSLGEYNMTKNKKILEAKKIIKEEKEKIRFERKNIRKKNLNKFKKTKIGSFLCKVSGLFKIDKDSFSFSQVLFTVIVTFLLGAFLMMLIIYIILGGKNNIKFMKDNKKFLDVYNTLINNYYGDIDKKKLEENLINGLVNTTGDNYTNYGDKDAALSFDETVTGVYEGIGCTILGTDKEIKVVTVYEGTPSYKAGLKSDDIILKVDNKEALELGSTEIANYIKNSGGKEISLVVKRKNEELTIKLKRDVVEIPVIEAKVLSQNDKKIGYMSISIFSSVSAKQFRNKITELEKENISGLIIDVRDNNGGFLTQVSEISSMILPKGKIIYQVSKDDKKKVTKDKTKEMRKYPIAILVNGNSASASEILAAVIKESYHGYVVGTKTFGKGTVQQMKKLSDGSMIKYTIENWLTPDGNWLNDKGVEPTDEIELNPEYYDNPVIENDNQLQKALDLVTK